jgi:serine phosphatase RsbU (regulator of sigma subunit)
VVAVALRSSTPVAPGVIGTLLTVAALVAVYAWDRERVGVQGALGASMLVDLRDRLRTQGTVPPLGRGWQVDTELRPAYGDSFSGDFLVAARPSQGDWVEFALVDVSGKGQPAGARALLLSGAFGGLLGAMPRETFLTAANHYLMRQDWAEGFATAVHVAVHLVDGDVEVRSAGHPPVVHFHSGAGRWEVVRSGQGPLLGVLDEPEYPAHRARLERGDALLLYTDGLVEDRRRDIALGIDRLIGAAERVMTRGLPGGASRIVEGTRTAGDDDRALVLIRRT